MYDNSEWKAFEKAQSRQKQSQSLIFLGVVEDLAVLYQRLGRFIKDVL